MYVNASGNRLLGYEPDELVGKLISEILVGRERHRVAGELSRALAGEVLTSEWTFAKKDGTPVEAEVTAQRLSGGRVMAIVRDLGQRRAFERRIRESEA